MTRRILVLPAALIICAAATARAEMTRVGVTSRADIARVPAVSSR